MRAKLVLVAIATVTGVSATALAQSPIQSGAVQSTFFAPARHQIDVDLLDMVDIVDPSSIVRRRLNSSPDTAIHLTHDLGTSTMQQVEFTPTFWFDKVNAAQFQFRYFFHYRERVRERAAYLQWRRHHVRPESLDGWHDLVYRPDSSTSGGLRRGLIEQQQSDHHGFKDGMCGQRSASSSFISTFRSIMHIRTFLEQAPHPWTYAGRWHDQELPGARGQRNRAASRGSAQLGVRSYGAGHLDQQVALGDIRRPFIVYLSQSTFETHLRMVYSNECLWGLRPFLGFSYYYPSRPKLRAGSGT